MLAFHVTLHAKGNGVTPGPVMELTGQAGAKLTVTTLGMSAERSHSRLIFRLKKRRRS